MQHKTARTKGFVNGLGFTLVELLVVIVIIGILAGVGYPQYRKYVLKANRAAAQSFMLAVAAREEQMMLDFRAYVPAAAEANFNAGAGSLKLAVPFEVSKFYDMKVETPAGSPPTYTITATRKAGTIQVNDVADLTLNNKGERTPASLW